MEKISLAQVANRPDQFLLAAARIDAMTQNGEASFLKADCANAFNSVNHKLVKIGLEAIRLHNDYIQYIMTMLENRTSDIGVPLTVGVPQGDPLSMLLFVVATNPLILKL